MAWTGGGVIATTMLTEPRSILGYRPNEFKELSKVVKDCQTGLSDENRLGMPQEGGGISFRLWNDKVKKELEERGMDGAFRILNATGTQETCLLEESGKATHDGVTTWIDSLRATPCQYEEQNMKMSAKFLMESIKVDLMAMVEQNIRENASGPEVYTAIVNLHQRVSTSAVRKLIDLLGKMSLKEEPGEDVQKFAGKVTDLAKRIIGTGSPPNDLIALIYKAFTKCSVETFRNTANSYYERADDKDPLYDNWETWLLKLQMRYQRDCDNGEWEPLKHNKESAALAGYVDSGADTRTCYHCGKKGHIKPNCPDKDKPAVGGGGGSSNNARVSYRTPPADGAAHTKSIEGLMYSWCGTCKRWNSGKKAHLTAEHKIKAKSDEVKVEDAPIAVPATAPEPIANVAAVSTGPSLADNHYFPLGYVGAICEHMVDCCFCAEVDDDDDDDRDGDLDLDGEQTVNDPDETIHALTTSAEAPLCLQGWSVSRYLNFQAGRR